MEKKSFAALVFSLILAPVILRGQGAATPTPTTPAAAASSSPGSSPSPAPPVITSSGTSVVDASRLTGILPQAPPGWSADKPEGSTSDSTGFPITTVSCVYEKGNADDAPTAAVNIIDSANNQQFQDATKAMWSATSSTAEGYDKTVTVDGLPGFEHFANADQTGVLWVICGGRFFVQIETTRQPPAELEAWLSRIDLKKLSTLR